MTRAALGLVLLCAAGPVLPASAQGAAAGPRPPRVTIAAGMAFQTAYPVGDVTAELRRNAAGVPAPFTLVRLDSELASTPGVEARGTIALTRALAVEAGGSYATPLLAVTMSGDPEASGNASASERLSQYTVEVSAIYRIAAVRIAGALRPYAIGGVGYLRQLHAENLEVATGRTIHAGGGLQYWLRGAAGRQRPLGVRAEARIVRRVRGIEFDDRARVYPAMSLLGFVGF